LHSDNHSLAAAILKGMGVPGMPITTEQLLRPIRPAQNDLCAGCVQRTQKQTKQTKLKEKQ